MFLERLLKTASRSANRLGSAKRVRCVIITLNNFKMKFSNLLYAFIIFSAISFTACSDDASNDLVDTATVENALDTNPNINVTETIAEDGSITYTAQQDGVNLSEFTLKTDDDGMTYISYNSQGNEVPTNCNCNRNCR